MTEYIFCYPPPATIENISKSIRFNKSTKEFNLYIHIPFCSRICYYCGYARTTNNTFKDQYIKYLLKEFDLYRNIFEVDKIPVRTIAFGGGTPALLNENEIEKLIIEINRRIEFVNESYLSIEATPVSLTEKKIRFLRNVGFNRLSIGVETFDCRTLNISNRIYDDKITKKIEYAKRYFNNLNVDIIIGLPGHNDYTIKDDIKILTELAPSAISFYRYFEHPNSKLWNLISLDKIKIPSSNKVSNWINKLINEFITNHWQLTKVYYLQKDYVDDLHYGLKWKNENILGLGLSSHSYIDGHLYFNYNFKNIKKCFNAYYEALDKNILPVLKYVFLNREEVKRRYMVLAVKNINILYNDYFENFGSSVYNDFSEELYFLKSNGLIEVNENEMFLTRKGVINWPEISTTFYSSSINRKLDQIKNNKLKYGSRFN